MNSRRDFLKGTGWMLGAAFAAGCTSRGFKLAAGGTMQGFAAPAYPNGVRVGVIGLGARGHWAMQRLAQIPGLEITAICDIRPARLAAEQAWRKEWGFRPVPHEFTGSEETWRRLCECADVDVVYSTTPWDLHVETGVYAMECGKHALIEVPAAMTVDDCWRLVETSERTRRHCMQLENCCYGEAEMLCLNLCKLGMLGDLVHGEAAYIHDLRAGNYMTPEADGYKGYYRRWRLEWNAVHRGNQYPTHGLGPVCEYMDINRGDRFESLVTMDSKQANFTAYAKAKFGPDSADARKSVAMGDMSTTVIRTARGRSILLQHDVSSPRPYRRHNVLTGTRGCFTGIAFAEKPEDAFTMGNACRFGWEEKPGAGVHRYFDFEKTKEMREKYRHPIWKQFGQVAAKVGGHGGMDFLMDLRWAYCLQNGLPLDMDVYDLATWCSVCELSDRSVRAGSVPQDVPDFTRGAWRTAPAYPINSFDLTKLDLSKFKPLKKTDVMDVRTGS